METFNGLYIKKKLSGEEYLSNDDNCRVLHDLVKSGFPRKTFTKLKDPYLDRCSNIRSGWRSDSDYLDYIECDYCKVRYDTLPEEGIFKVDNSTSEYIDHMLICYVCNNLFIEKAEDIIKIHGSIEYHKLINIYLLTTEMFKMKDVPQQIGLILYDLYTK